MKNYEFTWYKNEKYHKTVRHNLIKANSENDALSAFKTGFGNLNKNIIISIQEVDNEGNKIGEAIIPGAIPIPVEAEAEEAEDTIDI